MKFFLLTLLIGTILAAAYASPAPSKLQSLQALLQDDDGEKVALLQDEEDDDDSDGDLAKIEEALAQVIGGRAVGKNCLY